MTNIKTTNLESVDTPKYTAQLTSEFGLCLCEMFLSAEEKNVSLAQFGLTNSEWVSV